MNTPCNYLLCLGLIAGGTCPLGGQQLSKPALLEFVNSRYHAYFHWNMCTFKNLNSTEHSGRSSGTEPAAMWNPTGIDCAQWARVVKDSRMAGGWLTTKHHGGFCLWDSKVTDYDVAGNLAFHRPCTQSSTHPFIRDKRAYPRAEIAVDGVTEGDCMMEQTSLTNEEARPWWQVDLQRDCRIEEIKVYPRTDKGAAGPQDLRVSVLDNAGNGVWQHLTKALPFRKLTLSPGGARGRFVRIQLNDKGNLALAEVIISGKPLREN